MSKQTPSIEKPRPAKADAKVAPKAVKLPAPSKHLRTIWKGL